MKVNGHVEPSLRFADQKKHKKIFFWFQEGVVFNQHCSIYISVGECYILVWMSREHSIPDFLNPDLGALGPSRSIVVSVVRGARRHLG